MPTRHMVSLVAVLIAVFGAAVSQGNGPAYFPAYALVSLMLVSWIHNRGNVQQLEVTVHRNVNGFAGAVVLVPFKLRNLKKRPRFGLKISSSLGGKAKVGRLETLVEGTVSIPGLRRGIHQIKNLKVTSLFPIGVFQAAATYPVECECCVYPEAIGGREIPSLAGKAQPEKKGERVTGDDFAGVRNYKVGESQRHIDWKAVARGQPLMVKQFESTSQSEIWLDIVHLRSLELEAKLSQLTLWVMLSERTGLRYGLRLDGVSIPPAQGNTHYHRCLRALAAYPASGNSPPR